MKRLIISWVVAIAIVVVLVALYLRCTGLALADWSFSAIDFESYSID